MNIEKTRRMLRWTPQITLERGLASTAEWFVRSEFAAEGSRRPPVSAERGRSTGDWAGRLWLVAGLLVAVFCIARALPVIHAWDVTPGIGVDPFTDSITYLAAGERLNAGHDLYRLGPGDRPVLIVSDTFTAPLVSPPVIAVLWRPLAALPVGQAIWIAACWIVLLATVVYVVAKARWIGIGLTLILATPIADQLAVANAAAFFPALLILGWRLGDFGGHRRRPRADGRDQALAGLHAGLAGRDRAPGGRSRAWVATAARACRSIGAIGAGVGSYVDLPRRRAVDEPLGLEPLRADRDPVAVLRGPRRRDDAAAPTVGRRRGPVVHARRRGLGLRVARPVPARRWSRFSRSARRSSASPAARTRVAGWLRRAPMRDAAWRLSPT